ncbi:MAG: hypothetical protein LBW85_04045 [Deltaproteobacteria bacterium]|jgi:hypothetical protein|nr:hypothetical protein [Deltaproteobacteria bacterium]
MGRKAIGPALWEPGIVPAARRAEAGPGSRGETDDRCLTFLEALKASGDWRAALVQSGASWAEVSGRMAEDPGFALRMEEARSALAAMAELELFRRALSPGGDKCLTFLLAGLMPEAYGDTRRADRRKATENAARAGEDPIYADGPEERAMARQAFDILAELKRRSAERRGGSGKARAPGSRAEWTKAGRCPPHGETGPKEPIAEA